MHDALLRLGVITHAELIGTVDGKTVSEDRPGWLRPPSKHVSVLAGGKGVQELGIVGGEDVQEDAGNER